MPRLVTLTTKPTRMRHYASAPGVFYPGVPEIVAGEPASVITLPDELPTGHGADLWIGDLVYSGVAEFRHQNPVTGSFLYGIDRFPTPPPPPVPGTGPAPDFGPLRIVESDIIAPNGAQWKWRESTEFRLLKRLYDGEDIQPLLVQRKSCGANCVRVASMKFNNTGWHLDPRQDPARFWAALRELWRLAKAHEMYVTQSVFLDTRPLGFSQGEQHAFWNQMLNEIRAAGLQGFIFIELTNEYQHPTNDVDPAQFTNPTDLMASHGSGLTDADCVRPTWGWAGYHSRRDTAPDPRGFTNYDCYEFQALWEKECPMKPQEGCKPHHYGFDVKWASQMGRHANIGDGGTFHTEINSDFWSPEIEACARAFYKEIH